MISGQYSNSLHYCCRKKHKVACKQQAEQHLRVDITIDDGTVLPYPFNQSSSPSVSQTRGAMSMDVKHTHLFPVKIQVLKWLGPIP